MYALQLSCEGREILKKATSISCELNMCYACVENVKLKQKIMQNWAKCQVGYAAGFAVCNSNSS